MERFSSSLEEREQEQVNDKTTPLVSAGRKTKSMRSTKKSPKVLFHENRKPQKNSTASTKVSKTKKKSSSLHVEDAEEVISSEWRISTKYKKWGVNEKPFLPVDEDVFIEDMLSENPAYKSLSQLRSNEYWEEAAAVLPPYKGPFSTKQSALDK